MDKQDNQAITYGPEHRLFNLHVITEYDGDTDQDFLFAACDRVFDRQVCVSKQHFDDDKKDFWLSSDIPEIDAIVERNTKQTIGATLKARPSIHQTTRDNENTVDHLLDSLPDRKQNIFSFIHNVKTRWLADPKRNPESMAVIGSAIERYSRKEGTVERVGYSLRWQNTQSPTTITFTPRSRGNCSLKYTVCQERALKLLSKIWNAFPACRKKISEVTTCTIY